MRILRPLQTPARIPAKHDRPDAHVIDALRVLSETIVQLNERVELLEARELLRLR
jgi:hypothetical protein